MSSGREYSTELLLVEDTVAVQVLPPLRLVAEGAGLKDEEVELMGDGSMDEAESIQRAESRELMEPSRLLVPVVFVCIFSHGC